MWNYLPFVFMIVSVTSVCSAKNVYLEFNKVSSGGTRLWAAESNPGNPCPNSGGTCTIEIKKDGGATIVSSSDVQSLPYGFSQLTVSIGPVEYSSVDGSLSVSVSNPVGHVIDANLYSVRIVHWDEHPEKNGMTLALPMSTISSQNTIQLLVP